MSDPCNGCKQHDSCAEVYRALGHAPGPSVTGEVLRALVLPPVVFIGALAAADHFLSRVFSARMGTCVALAAALTATAAAIYLGRVFGRHSRAGETVLPRGDVRR